ncbi:cytochrome P450 [Nocardia higoensis]|uniref:Cytochrome P450 n=1 Tax=Nocardia higoensis TaxID=228599 RepID=A0ABS0DFW5_9NOCA|nr:cytochrome P450 [Nocardia higoensis]MBF6357367.1 cytochrome P450 [Nocardia higoensis]
MNSAEQATAWSGCPAHPGAVPLDGPEFLSDPYGLYARVRRECGPVVPVELYGGFPAWLVIGYRELHQVTSDSELFNRKSDSWNQWPNVPEDWPLRPMVGMPVPSIYYTVGAEHRRHSEMVEAALDGVDPFALRRTVEDIADRLIDSFCGRGRADLVAEYAEPLPLLALASTLGFAAEDGSLLAWTMRALSMGGADAQAAHVRFYELMARLLAQAKTRGGDDIVTRMLNYPAPFTDEEYIHNLMAITAAGYLPTSDWLVNSVRLMLVDDRFAAALGGGRHSIGQAMNEVLWEEAPTQILAGRWATRDTRLGNQVIRAGDMLLLGLGAANSDPHVRQQLGDGPEPAQAGNSAHFAFSHGEFRCPFPAQQIAEVISRTGIEVLLDRLPDIDLAVPEHELVRKPNPWLRGLSSVPVRYTPVPVVGGF